MGDTRCDIVSKVLAWESAAWCHCFVVNDKLGVLIICRQPIVIIVDGSLSINIEDDLYHKLSSIDTFILLWIEDVHDADLTIVVVIATVDLKGDLG